MGLTKFSCVPFLTPHWDSPPHRFLNVGSPPCLSNTEVQNKPLVSFFREQQPIREQEPYPVQPCGKTFSRCLCKTMRKSNRKQQQKITRVHGLIGWGQSDLLEQMEREECRLSNAPSAQVRKLLAHALVASLMFLRGDLCSQPYGALCTENNIEVQKKNINWRCDREHGKLMLS